MYAGDMISTQRYNSGDVLHTETKKEVRNEIKWWTEAIKAKVDLKNMSIR